MITSIETRENSVGMINQLFTKSNSEKSTSTTFSLLGSPNKTETSTDVNTNPIISGQLGQPPEISLEKSTEEENLEAINFIVNQHINKMEKKIENMQDEEKDAKEKSLYKMIDRLNNSINPDEDTEEILNIKTEET